MRIKTLYFLLLLFVSQGGLAQSFSLYYHGIKLPPDTTITRAGTTDSLELTTFFTIRNDAATEKQIQEKKTEISMVPGTACSLCWAGYCYPTEIFETEYPLVLAPGASETSCFAHFITGGLVGASTVRWTWFDKDNPADSVSVLINYITYPMAIENLEASHVVVSPNPADREAGFRLDATAGSRCMLQLRTLSGVIVFQDWIPLADGRLKINTSGFAEGIYLYAVQSAGKLLGSGKLVVSHR